MSYQRLYEPTYLAGLITSWASATTLDVASGECVDSTNTYLLQFGGGTIDAATTGALGLDAGTLTDFLFWHPFLIGKVDGTVSALLSGSADGTTPEPTLPAGYTLYRALPGVWMQSAGALVWAAHSRYGRNGVKVDGLNSYVGLGSQVARTEIDLSSTIPATATQVGAHLLLNVANNTVAKRTHLYLYADSANGNFGHSVFVYTPHTYFAVYRGAIGWMNVSSQSVWYMTENNGGTSTYYLVAVTIVGWIEGGD